MSEKWQMRIAQLERENRLLISRALRAERRVEAMGFAAQVEERARSRQAGTAHDVDRLLERITRVFHVSLLMHYTRVSRIITYYN